MFCVPSSHRALGHVCQHTVQDVHWKAAFDTPAPSRPHSDRVLVSLQFHCGEPGCAALVELHTIVRAGTCGIYWRLPRKLPERASFSSCWFRFPKDSVSNLRGAFGIVVAVSTPT